MISSFFKCVCVFQIAICFQQLIFVAHAYGDKRLNEWDPTLSQNLQINNEFDLIKRIMEKMLNKNDQDISNYEYNLVSSYLNSIVNNSNKRVQPVKFDYWLLRQGK